MDAPFRLNLVGAFTLFGPDGTPVPVTSRKGQALLAMLALSRSGIRARSWLQDRLWGDAEPSRGAGCLRRELSNLRPLLNGATPLLLADQQQVRLDLTQLSVDLRQIEEDVAAGRRPRLGGGGELLEGFDLPACEGFEEWLRDQRAAVAALFDQARSMVWRQETLAAAEPDPGRNRVRPTLAVLPFLDDPNSPVGIAAAFSEEIGNVLSGWSTLATVSAVPPSRPTDYPRLARDLGARYLLDGRVGLIGGRVRVSAWLVDGAAAEKLWSEVFTGTAADLFDIQERTAAAVAPLIDSSIEKNERRRAMQRPVATPGAWDLYWRASAAIRQWRADTTAEAVMLADRVLELEPGNAWAAALAAFGHAAAVVAGWSQDPEADRAAARRRFDTAMAAGSDDPYVIGQLAAALLGMGGDPHAAEALVSRALAANPRMPATLFWAGWIALARQQPAQAQSYFTAALRLNPRMAVRPYALAGMALAMHAAGQHTEAVAAAREAHAAVPHFPPAALALALTAGRK